MTGADVISEAVLLRTTSNVFGETSFGLIIPDDLVCDIVELSRLLGIWLSDGTLMLHTHFNGSIAPRK